MWQRFVRAIKALFGGAISSIENPRLILEENIREMNAQVPKMNQNIATVKANVVLLQKEQARYEAELATLTSKIKAGIQAGRDDIAANYAMQLEKAKQGASTTKEQLAYATAAYDKALQVKKVFMAEKERKINEAKEAMREYDRSQWQKKVADTLESFEVGGVSDTHDEMIQRVREQSAKNEARMELALDSIDTDSLQIEEDAEKIRAAELVKQFKLEMGMDTPKPQIEIPDADVNVDAGRSLGRNREGV
jgi:phage shock protein A